MKIIEYQDSLFIDMIQDLVNQGVYRRLPGPTRAAGLVEQRQGPRADRRQVESKRMDEVENEEVGIRIFPGDTIPEAGLLPFSQESDQSGTFAVTRPGLNHRKRVVPEAGKPGGQTRPCEELPPDPRQVESGPKHKLVIHQTVSPPGRANIKQASLPLVYI